MKKINLIMVLLSIVIVLVSSSIYSQNNTCELPEDFISSGESIFREINVKEGKFLRLNLSTQDEDNDNINIIFSEPFDESGTWNISYNDSGCFVSKITLDDSKTKSDYYILINVENVNRLPEIYVEDVSVMETQTIILNYSVEDADNDNLEVFFEPPFDKEGQWETQLGDAGVYQFEATVYDGKNTTSYSYDVEIIEKPMPSKLIAKEVQYAKEGENFTIDYEVQKERDYNIEFIGDINQETTYFDYDSKREYNVQMKLSDELFNVTENVTILVEDVNQAPIINGIKIKVNDKENYYDKVNLDDIELKEGDVVKFDIDAIDYDNDKLNETYQPFDKEFTLDYESAGVYNQEFIVNDSKNHTKVEVILRVLDTNRLPVIKANDTYYTKEGETFYLNISVEDLDMDKIALDYFGYMNSTSKYIDYDQAGEYEVIIKADDGKDVVEKEVKVVVEDVNRAPVITEIRVIVISNKN